MPHSDARRSVTVMPHSDAASIKKLIRQRHRIHTLDAASECGMTATDYLAWKRM